MCAHHDMCACPIGSRLVLSHENERKKNVKKCKKDGKVQEKGIKQTTNASVCYQVTYRYAVHCRTLIQLQKLNSYYSSVVCMRRTSELASESGREIEIENEKKMQKKGEPFCVHLLLLFSIEQNIITIPLLWLNIFSFSSLASFKIKKICVYLPCRSSAQHANACKQLEARH